MDGKDALDKIVQTSDSKYRAKPKKKSGMNLSKALRMVCLVMYTCRILIGPLFLNVRRVGGKI